MIIKPVGLKSVQGLMSVYQNVQKQKIPIGPEKAYLAKGAMEDLYKANISIVDEGGRLYISSMWRDPEEQFKAWLDFKSGRKNSYSPPPCFSMHECGRAIDIDTRSDSTKITHDKLRAILSKYNWYPVVPVGQPGDWHYEHRTAPMKNVLATKGYKAMVSLAFDSIKYRSIEYDGVDYEGENIPQSWM
jgi:hypothetical protein